VLDQRASAAFLAASLRCSGVMLAARAFPPLSPPFRPSATAAGSFPSSGSNGGASPVASSTTCRASSFGSVGRLRDRSGISQSVAAVQAKLLRVCFERFETITQRAVFHLRRVIHARLECHVGGCSRTPRLAVPRAMCDDHSGGNDEGCAKEQGQSFHARTVSPWQRFHAGPVPGSVPFRILTLTFRVPGEH
jgi:hypothetical protein